MDDGDLLPELFAALKALAARKETVFTISRQRPNRIASVSPEGVRIETEASAAKRLPPQLVPAWMLNDAWEHLRRTGRLENEYVLADHGLNIKRSSAVCALLAQLPGVQVESRSPIVLTFRAPGAEP